MPDVKIAASSTRINAVLRPLDGVPSAVQFLEMIYNAVVRE